MPGPPRTGAGFVSLACTISLIKKKKNARSFTKNIECKPLNLIVPWQHFFV